MLVAFAVDPDALAMNGIDTPIRTGVHTRLLRAWRDFGVLLLPSDPEGSREFAQAIAQLPQDLRKRWQQALMRHRRLRGPAGWYGLSRADDRADLQCLSGHLHLACFEGMRAVRLGLPKSKASKHFSDWGFEICRFDCADQSRSFQRAIELSTEEIPKGTSPTSLWEERFSALSRLSRHVVIVDRYAITRQKRRRDRLGGLRFLLERIGEVSSPHSVVIYSAKDEFSARTHIEGVRRLIDSSPSDGIGELTVHMLEDADFKQVEHSRYIRFDDTVCILDTGCEVFEGNAAYRSCRFSVHPMSPGDRQREGELRSRARVSEMLRVARR